MESSTLLATTLPEQARVTISPCSKESCKGMSCPFCYYFLGIRHWEPPLHFHRHGNDARPRSLQPAASPAEVCKGRTSGPRRLVSVAFARALLQRRLALCYNHTVCKVIVMSLLAFPPQTSNFSAAHSDSNIRILFRLKFGTQGLRPSWGAISTFFGTGFQ